MGKCYGPAVAKSKGKSQKGKAAPAKAATKPAKGAKPAAAPLTLSVPPPGRSVKPAAPPAKGKAAPKLPLVAVKPKKPTKPSLPAPPPAPVAPPPRDELPAPRDIARLTRYGERFGANKIDVRWLPLTLPVNSTQLAVFDPAAPKSWRVFDRPVRGGQFRAMLSIARIDDGKGGFKERLAAITIHCGQPPIARWSVAHYKGQKKPKSADQLPRVPVTSGWVGLIDAGKSDKDVPGVVAVPATPNGLAPVEVPLTDGRKVLALPCGEGEFCAYWAVDATDKPICLVLDFDCISQKDWKARAPQ
jgi:hypothetical protein